MFDWQQFGPAQSPVFTSYKYAEISWGQRRDCASHDYLHLPDLTFAKWCGDEKFCATLVPLQGHNLVHVTGHMMQFPRSVYVTYTHFIDHLQWCWESPRKTTCQCMVNRKQDVTLYIKIIYYTLLQAFMVNHIFASPKCLVVLIIVANNNKK